MNQPSTGLLDQKGTHAAGDVSAATQAEIERLRATGLDVSVIETPDQYRSEPDRLRVIGTAIAKLEVSAAGAAEFRALPAIKIWSTLRKRAIALDTLYNPDGDTLGSGIDPAVYEAPIFGVQSANGARFRA